MNKYKLHIPMDHKIKKKPNILPKSIGIQLKIIKPIKCILYISAVMTPIQVSHVMQFFFVYYYYIYIQMLQFCKHLQLCQLDLRKFYCKINHIFLLVSSLLSQFIFLFLVLSISFLLNIIQFYFNVQHLFCLQKYNNLNKNNNGTRYTTSQKIGIKMFKKYKTNFLESYTIFVFSSSLVPLDQQNRRD